MSNDQMQSVVAQTKSNIKKFAGKLVGGKNTERRGRMQPPTGKLQQKYGKRKEDLQRTAEPAARQDSDEAAD